MMPNTIAFDADWHAKKATAEFHANNSLCMTAAQDYTKDFIQNRYGVGDTIKIRLRNRYEAVEGLDVSSNVQSIEEATVPLTLEKVISVPVELNALESTYELPRDEVFDRVVQPQIPTLAKKVEEYIHSKVEQNINYFTGSASSTINSFEVMALARAKMLKLEMPMTMNPCIALDPFDAAYLKSATSLQNNFNSILNKQISINGALSNIAGFDLYENQSVRSHTSGTAAAESGITVNGEVTSGNQIVVANAGTATFKVGDIITVEGVNAVSPLTQTDSGQTMSFVITQDVTAAAGAATLNVSPSIVTTGPRKNVSVAIPDTAAVTVVGSHKINLAYTKGGIILAAPPMKPVYQFDNATGKIAEMGATYSDPDTGLSLSLWVDGDALKGTSYMRLGILVGSLALQDYCIRVISQV